MKISLSKEDLVNYVISQLNHFFPDQKSTKPIAIKIDLTLDRLEYCFSAINNSYYRTESGVNFNHLHSDQYATFLYFLANTLYRKGIEKQVCEKIYYLNKCLHSIDVYFEVELPDIFLFAHSVGTVLGRAKYSNYFRVQQNCTVGGAREAQQGFAIEYPHIGPFVSVYVGASILGNCNIGENCKISAQSVLLDQDLPPNSIYIGTHKNNIIKSNRYKDLIWDLETDNHSELGLPFK